MPNSNLDPTQQFNSLAISSRVNPCYMATIAAYWKSHNRSIKSISKIIRITVEEYARLMVESGEADLFTTIDEATKFLYREDLLSETQCEAQYERLRKEMIHKASPNRKVKGRTPSIPQVPTVSPEQFAKAQAALEQGLSKSSQQQVVDAAARTQEYKDTLASGPRPEKETLP